MKKLRLVSGCLALLTLSDLIIPQVAFAQSSDGTASFTSQALIVGFLVLAVIVLVFLGLMLKARVNELRSFIRRKTVKRTESASQEMMHLDEAEINALLVKRQQDRARNPPPATS